MTTYEKVLKLVFKYLELQEKYRKEFLVLKKELEEIRYKLNDKLYQRILLGFLQDDVNTSLKKRKKSILSKINSMKSITRKKVTEINLLRNKLTTEEKEMLDFEINLYANSFMFQNPFKNNKEEEEYE